MPCNTEFALELCLLKCRTLECKTTQKLVALVLYVFLLAKLMPPQLKNTVFLITYVPLKDIHENKTVNGKAECIKN